MTKIAFKEAPDQVTVILLPPHPNTFLLAVMRRIDTLKSKKLITNLPYFQLQQ